MNITLTDIIQFTSLFILLSVSAIIFNNVGDNLERFFIIFVDCVMYIVWGCWHHYTKDRLDKIVLLEYTLVSVIVAALAAMGLGIVRFF